MRSEGDQSIRVDDHLGTVCGQETEGRTVTRPNIDLTVVVNGDDQSVTVNLNQKVESLMREALRKVGINNPDLSEWHLRFEEGGPVIGADQKVADAGISNGMTLYLDPDEGGGGQIAAVLAKPHPEPASDPLPVLVDPEVSRTKVARMLDDWQAREAEYRERGWLLLSHDDLQVEVAFACRLPIGSFPDVVALPLAIRFGFENYDVWPPSVEVIDPIERRSLGAARLQALDYARVEPGRGPQQVFVGNHPKTGRVFLCKRGVREYHSHPEHNGDDWLLHRGKNIGTLTQLCTLLWRLTTRTVTGLDFRARRVDIDQQMLVEMQVAIAQDDVDSLRQQSINPLVLQEGAPFAAQPLPPELGQQILAALQAQQSGQ